LDTAARAKMRLKWSFTFARKLDANFFGVAFALLIGQGFRLLY